MGYFDRAPLVLFCALAASAQSPRTATEALQEYAKAHRSGNVEEAAARRQQARSLSMSTPVESPLYAASVQSLAQIYNQVGMYAEGRAVLQEGLTRSAILGDSHPTRIQLLNALAEAWQQDRNVLKTAEFLEKALTAQEAAARAPRPEPQAPTGRAEARFLTTTATGIISGVPSAGYAYLRVADVFRSGVTPSYQYARLADLYRQLGRPDAVAAVEAKMLAAASADDSAMASFYERQGKIDEAAAVYRKQAEQLSTSAPDRAVGAFQVLADLYVRDQRIPEAVNVYRQAAVMASQSQTPDSLRHAVFLRQRLAALLRQSGLNAEADQMHAQVLEISQGFPGGVPVHVITTYAGYLSETGRGEQADDLLKGYIAARPKLEPWEESSIYFALARAAGAHGDSDRAANYNRLAMERQKPPETADEPGSMALALQKAQAAANAGRTDDAFSLALEAMGLASKAPDRDQLPWQIVGIAGTLAPKESAKADQLFERLFATLRAWSADTLQPLLHATSAYPAFLMSQRNRRGQTLKAIEDYRNLLIAAHGPGTGWLEETLRLTLQFERSYGSRQKAIEAAQALLDLAESLSGPTSEQCMHHLMQLADLLHTTGQPERALPLYYRAVKISDLVSRPGDQQRVRIRMNAAIALASAGRFDEAESLVDEGIALDRVSRHPEGDKLLHQREQIRRMRQ